MSPQLRSFFFSSSHLYSMFKAHVFLSHPADSAGQRRSGGREPVQRRHFSWLSVWSSGHVHLGYWHLGCRPVVDHDWHLRWTVRHGSKYPSLFIVGTSHFLKNILWKLAHSDVVWLCGRLIKRNGDNLRRMRLAYLRGVEDLIFECNDNFQRVSLIEMEIGL